MQRKTKTTIGLALAAGVAVLGGVAGMANAEVPSRAVKFEFENVDATPIQMCVSNTNGNAEQCADVSAPDGNSRVGEGSLEYNTDQQEVLVKAKDNDGPGEPQRVKIPDDAKVFVGCSYGEKGVICSLNPQ